MKRVLFLLSGLAVFTSCKNASEPRVAERDEVPQDSYESYTSVGEIVSLDGILSAEEMSEEFAALEIGDTIDAKFAAEVASVCKNKGCWMNLKLQNGEEAAVKFQDYAFFVPKDIEDKEVVVNGKAFVSMTSVEEQKHYAEDAGKSPEQISKITEPRKTLSFIADGVLIEQ